MQFHGPVGITDTRPATLGSETYSYLSEFKELRRRLDLIEEACRWAFTHFFLVCVRCLSLLNMTRPGCSPTLINVTNKSLCALTDIISAIQSNEGRR
jgi:hypothetical protein